MKLVRMIDNWSACRPVSTGCITRKKLIITILTRLCTSIIKYNNVQT